MHHAKEKLNHDVRKTIADMRDDYLINMVQFPHGNYTKFALEEAHREVTRRGGLEALKRNVKEGLFQRTPREPEHIKAPEVEMSHRTQRLNLHKRKEKDSTAPAASGCYIEGWQRPNFEGESLRIDGPGAIADLCGDGLSWCGKIRSLRVGPEAFVLAYGDKQFEGDIMRVGPGEEIPDLGNVKFNEIDSVRIIDSIKVFDCTSPEGEVKSEE